MNVLITGASGFTGRFMVRFLASLGNVSITGLARNDKTGLPRSTPTISWFFADLMDPKAINSTVSSSRPDAVLHLAGRTRGTLPELRAANVDGTRILLDAVIQTVPSCPVVVVSSSAVYGYAGSEPIPETHQLNPVSDYGISKVEQEALCRKYAATRKCRIAIARPFNLVGPGQPETFVCGRIIRQVIEMELGTRTALDLLETGSFRDFIDVRDVVKAYWGLLSHPEFDSACAGKAFNMGSGDPKSIADVIRILEKFSMIQYPIHLPEKPFTVPVPYQKSDNNQISMVTGWKPAIPLSTSLRDMLDAARMKTG
jgi:GDP-4-dehydro-6-deoxy-D-mannose reductase